tara:strand:- start:745 stop:1878 length:1134 start_codon:yes stop_codon:yes gene_type:complete
VDKLVTPSLQSVVFRCDAALFIGNGHVMRCLTLADAIAAMGIKCSFICREFEGHLGPTIIQRGHDLRLLPKPTSEAMARIEDYGPYAGWLGTSIEQDAAQTATIVKETGANRVITDHYAINADWHSMAVPAGIPIFAIDDLANRTHACDILLDQNLGRKEEDYAGLVDPSTISLIGPKYALLKPEFAEKRAASLLRRRSSTLRKILVSMGGVDADDATSRVINTLNHAELPIETEITVVLGPSAPHKEAVRQRAATMPYPTEFKENVSDMASLMASADLAIGAMGSTAWERCCLGLPILALAIAENQNSAALALEATGAGLLLGDLSDSKWSKRLEAGLEQAQIPEILEYWSRSAANVCDGRGTQRILAHIIPELVQ